MTDNTTAIQTTKTEINLELTKLGLNYEKLLQAASDITFTEDTIDQDYLPLKQLREVKTKLADIENPYTKQWSGWNKSRKSLADPVDKILQEKTAEFTKMAAGIKAKNEKVATENARIDGIKSAITTFALDFSTKIASATTNEELSALQDTIWAENGRKGFYQEFMPKLLEATEGLKNALKAQKARIKELAGIVEEKAQAELSGDDQKLMELIAKEETISSRIEETKTTVQQTALDTVSKTGAVVAEPILSAAPKPRRTTWEWKVYDLALLQKKRPELVELVAKDSEIEKIIKQRRESKTICAGKTDGIEIYQKEHY